MSASPQRFDFLSENRTPEDRLSSNTQVREPEVLAEMAGTAQATKKWRLYTVLGLLLTFAAGVMAGYVVYLLWEQVSLHDSQIARQQAAIQQLAANGAAVSNQVGRLKALDSSVDSLRAQFEMQSQRLAELEKGQSGIRDQMAGMNARWQREVNELSKVKSPVSTPPPAVAASATVSNAPPPAPTTAAPSTPQPPAEKHNETFSPDLKPTPNAYAQMSPSGLVVWMTPRPGFSKPVPTSVIGHVRGLGMLVHDWDDNSHYFITESGSWMPDQR